MALSVTVASPLVFGEPVNSKGWPSSVQDARLSQRTGEAVAYSRITATTYEDNGACAVQLTSPQDMSISNNEVVKEDTLVNIEVSLLDPVTQMITGSENILTFWEKSSNGGLTARGKTLLEEQGDRMCVVTNVSVPGNTRAKIIIGNGSMDIVEFPNGKIEKGALGNPHTVAPILSSIFTTHMQEALSPDYVDGIPNDIGDEDYRLVDSGNVENYASLMRLVLSGETGIQGSTDSGYSMDFLELKSAYAINRFLRMNLIEPAVNLGLVSQDLANDQFADLLRKYILAEMDQDSSYEYGSENHVKASIALQYSPRYSSAIQLADGIQYLLKDDYLLDEYQQVIKDYEQQLVIDRVQPSMESPSERVKAIYELPIDFKQWSGSKRGRVGDIYIYDNPYSDKTEIFRLKTSTYSYFPTGGESNHQWEFIGPREWNTPGNKDDIYIYDNPHNNAIDFFQLKGNSGAYFPTDRTSNSNWTYIEPFGGFSSPLNVSPIDALELAILANEFRGLEGVELSRAILTKNGKISIDMESRIIYSTEKSGGVLGYNVAELASLAFGVETDDVTTAQIIYVQLALENLLIDTLYSYGSMNNVKATVLNRIAHEVMDEALLDEIGTGTEPFVLDELIKNNAEWSALDFEALVKDYVATNYRLNGMISNENDMISVGSGVQLFEDSNYKGHAVTIAKDIPDLSRVNFNDRLSSFIIPDGWKVEFYTDANYRGKKYTRTGAGSAPVNDAISSIKVIKAPVELEEDKFVEVFEHGSFQGAQNIFNKDVPDFSRIGLSLNDRISSYRIPRGWKVRFYEGENFQGPYYTRTGTGNLPVGVISSVKVISREGDGVILYDNISQVGDFETVSHDIADLSSINFNDKTSSMFIPNGWEVQFFEHSHYRGKKYTRNGSGFIQAPLNNAFSSIKILRAPTSGAVSSQKIELFEGLGQSGSKLEITDNIPTLSSIGGTFNDKISSYKIPDGWTVRFYEHGNYQGAYHDLSGNGDMPVHDVASSAKIIERPSYSEDTGLTQKSVKDVLYEGLLTLEKAQDDLAKHFVLVAYDNGEKVETLPLTDELFARAQLFKYGLTAEAVEDLWKPYLHKGFLRLLSDSRINGNHLAKEREMATGPAQDMWDAYFNQLVPVAANYLSTLIDYKLKVAGKESLAGREASKTTLRLAHGLEVDEKIRSQYFNGIWGNWVHEPDNWLIYGPDLDYSVKTAGNIFDFMSLSDVSFDEKMPYASNQTADQHEIGLRDFKLFETLDESEANKYCSKFDWREDWGIPLSKPGALGLEAVKYQCGAKYITRSTNLMSMQDSFEHIIAEMMKTKKWDLKTVQTERDLIYMILQMFIPVWGTVEAFQKGDNLGGVTGLFGDYMFFMGIASSSMSTLMKAPMKLATRPAGLVGKGVSLAIGSGDDVTGAVVQVNKAAAKIRAKDVIKVVAKSTFDELNPLAGLDELAVGAVKKATKKLNDIRGGNKIGAVSPKVYKSRDLELPRISQEHVDVDSGVGMPSKDRVAFADVADRENIVIGVRPVDVKSASLIESGLYGSKNLLVKSKSSDWGPHSGFIPVKQKYAKKSARNNVDKFDHYSQNSLNTGVAVEVPLSITDKRLKELQGFGAVKDLHFDEATGMYRAGSDVDDMSVNFYYEETSLGGNKGWNVYVKEDGELKPLNVMVSPDSNKAMTADYDLFTVMYHNSDFGVENSLKQPKTWDEWKESVVYDDLSPEYKEMYNDKQLYDTKGAGALGVISERVKDLKNKINNRLGRGKGMEMVHHGADDANPYAVLEDNFPATFFVPSRLLKSDGLGDGMGSVGDYFPITAEGTVILRTKEDFANFHQVVVNTHFTGPLNEQWAKGNEILSRRARLSHVYLDARDQVAAALGAQVGNYKPYHPKPRPQPNDDIYVTNGPITSEGFEAFVFDKPVYDIMPLEGDFYIVNNKYRVVMIDGVYFRAEYDPVLNVHYIYDSKGNRIPIKADENKNWVIDNSVSGSCTLPR